jgi:hypothetical protein
MWANETLEVTEEKAAANGSIERPDFDEAVTDLILRSYGPFLPQMNLMPLSPEITKKA